MPKRTDVDEALDKRNWTVHVTVANRHGRLWVTDYNGPTI